MELQGKIINFLGDSITQGFGVDDVENNRYDNVMLRKCGLKAVNNYGIGGTKLAFQYKLTEKSPPSDLFFCGRAFYMELNADVVVIYGGVNDYLQGDAPFGQVGDKTPATFCGAVHYLMSTMKNRYAHATVVFLTPARMCYEGVPDTQVSTRVEKQPDAKPLSAYVDVIKEAGQRIGVPVLDLYSKLPIDPKITEDAQRYTADGLHFNDAGHEVLADCLIDFLKNL